MNKHIIKVSLFALLLAGTSACNNQAKNNSAATSTTEPSTNTTPAQPAAPLTAAEIKQQYMEAAAQKICSCEGAVQFYDLMKLIEQTKESKKAPTAAESVDLFQKLKPATKAMETCIKSVEEERLVKYPESKKDASFGLAMVKVCGDKLPKSMLEAVKKQQDKVSQEQTNQDKASQDQATKAKQDKMNNK